MTESGHRLGAPRVGVAVKCGTPNKPAQAWGPKGEGTAWDPVVDTVASGLQPQGCRHLGTQAHHLLVHPGLGGGEIVGVAAAHLQVHLELRLGTRGASHDVHPLPGELDGVLLRQPGVVVRVEEVCLLYTSDAADE